MIVALMLMASVESWGRRRRRTEAESVMLDADLCYSATEHFVMTHSVKYVTAILRRDRGTTVVNKITDFAEEFANWFADANRRRSETSSELSLNGYGDIIKGLDERALNVTSETDLVGWRRLENDASPAIVIERLPTHMIAQGLGYAAAYTLLVAYYDGNAIAGEVFAASSTGNVEMKRNACGAIVNFVNNCALTEVGPLMIDQQTNEIVVKPNIADTVSSATFVTLLSTIMAIVGGSTLASVCNSYDDLRVVL